MKTINFSIGQRIQKEAFTDEDFCFIDLKVYGLDEKRDLINISSAAIVGLYEERPFKQSLNIFVTPFHSKKSENFKISIIPGVTAKIREEVSVDNDIDYQDVTPLFYPSAFRATPMATEAAGIHFNAVSNQKVENLPCFYLLLSLNSRINSDTFDIMK